MLTFSELFMIILWPHNFADRLNGHGRIWDNTVKWETFATRKIHELGRQIVSRHKNFVNFRILGVSSVGPIHYISERYCRTLHIHEWQSAKIHKDFLHANISCFTVRIAFSDQMSRMSLRMYCIVRPMAPENNVPCTHHCLHVLSILVEDF